MLRKLFPFTGLFIFFNLLLFPANGSVGNVKTGSRPDWVIDRKPDLELGNLNSKSYGGYYYLLVDFQDNLAREASFYHIAVKLFNSDGVQNMSDISVDFDPGFQTLQFHSINRFRDGIRTNELLNHKIKVIQREPEMERYLYDGRLTAIVNLEDIREGDIIEYSYSVSGYNPIYKGNFFKGINLEYNDPVKEIYRRVISPKGKPLFLNYPYGKIEPVFSEKDKTTGYTWQIADAKAHLYDNNVPAWYNDNTRVLVSTLDSWSDVVNLCIDNYSVPEVEMGKLKKKAVELFGQPGKDPVPTSLVRFVQDNIRYLGFESGLNAYKPMQPVRVMESRYADCKAKSLLLCSLLKIYGIEAYPVLVNSEKIKFENRVFPSPDIFNHCITQVNYKDQILYIDPTLSSQGGNISGYYCPDYGYGLVLKKGTAGLCRVFSTCQSKTEVKNYFKVDSIGAAVSYKVTTEYTGSYADDQRAYFLNSSDDEITKSFLKFYSKTYPHIRQSKPVKYTDDRDKNLFVVEEEYIIDSMWVPVSDEPGKLEFGVSALVINSAVSLPSSPERKMPYLISYPSDYSEDIFIDLPIDWVVKPKNTEIRDSVFSFSYTSSYGDKRIHLKYKYQTFSDFQDGKSFNSFYSRHSKILDCLNYNLTYSSKKKVPFVFSWGAAFSFCILLALSILISFRVYRNYNLPISSFENREIGGWLVLIAIGLFLSALRVAVNIASDSNYFDQKTWTTFLDPSARNIPMYILECFEFIYNSVLLVFLILLQYLFYKKRNILPRLIIIFYAVNFFFLASDTFLAHTISPDSYTDAQKNKSYLDIFESLAVAAIWITYFLNSKRVKATFTTIYTVKNELPAPTEM